VGPSDPATYGKEVTGTVLENVTITYCSRVAGYFRGDGLIIRNSLVSDTGTEGIYVIGSSNVLLERNIIRRNNIEQLTGYYASAVKIFNQTHRVTFRDNLVLDNPNSNGVWYDVGNRDGVFVNNYVEGALVGFMFEISRGVTVAGNVFVRNGRGVWILNSADARVYDNTFVDNPATFGRTERSAVGDHFSWHPATGPDVDQREGHVFVNNLLVASEAFRDPLVRFDQPPSLDAKLTRPQAKKADGNVYVRAAAPGTLPLIVWAPTGAPDGTATLSSLAAFRKLAPQFEVHGRLLDLSARSIFKSPDMGRYELRRALSTAVGMPADVLKLVGWKKGAARTVGAYPFAR
jgi:parallel beta-helix repeat protein